MQILVLGPFQVQREGWTLPVGGAAVRAVLGALVVSANRPVSVDRLSDVVWGAAPPPGAANALQALVSRVRRLVGRDAVVLVEHAYLLRAGCEEIDACRFEHLVQEAAARIDQDPGTAQEGCRLALALWRGEPYGELSSVEPFHVEALRLAELRRLAVEIELRARVMLGDDACAIPALRAAVAEDPYREHLWRWLVEALVHEDRRGEALEALAVHDRVLGEVGLAASEEMAGLRARLTERGRREGRPGRAYHAGSPGT